MWMRVSKFSDANNLAIAHLFSSSTVFFFWYLVFTECVPVYGNAIIVRKWHFQLREIARTADFH